MPTVKQTKEDILDFCYPFFDNMNDEQCEQDMDTLAELLDTLIHRVQSTSKDTLLWEFKHLGGYELMRDGTQIETCSSHIEALDTLNLYEVLYDIPKHVYLEIVNDLKSDQEAFNFIEANWSKRFNDGGGWGRVSCSNITNLLTTLLNFEFSHYNA